jgi:hypothetical protein
MKSRVSIWYLCFHLSWRKTKIKIQSTLEEATLVKTWIAVTSEATLVKTSVSVEQNIVGQIL